MKLAANIWKLPFHFAFIYACISSLQFYKQQLLHHIFLWNTIAAQWSCATITNILCLFHQILKLQFQLFRPHLCPQFILCGGITGPALLQLASLSITAVCFPANARLIPEIGSATAVLSAGWDWWLQHALKFTHLDSWRTSCFTSVVRKSWNTKLFFSFKSCYGSQGKKTNPHCHCRR